MKYTPRFELQNKTMCWNYRIKWYAEANPHDNDRYWQHEENWYVLIGISHRLFDYEKFEFNYYEQTTVTILGIVFGKGYSYQDERIL
jgi:hypothetical protein